MTLLASKSLIRVVIVAAAMWMTVGCIGGLVQAQEVEQVASVPGVSASELRRTGGDSAGPGGRSPVCAAEMEAVAEACAGLEAFADDGACDELDTRAERMNCRLAQCGDEEGDCCTAVRERAACHAAAKSGSGGVRDGQRNACAEERLAFDVACNATADSCAADRMDGAGVFFGCMLEVCDGSCCNATTTYRDCRAEHFLGDGGRKGTGAGACEEAVAGARDACAALTAEGGSCAELGEGGDRDAVRTCVVEQCATAAASSSSNGTDCCTALEAAETCRVEQNPCAAPLALAREECAALLGEGGACEAHGGDERGRRICLGDQCETAGNDSGCCAAVEAVRTCHGETGHRGPGRHNGGPGSNKSGHRYVNAEDFAEAAGVLGKLFDEQEAASVDFEQLLVTTDGDVQQAFIEAAAHLSGGGGGRGGGSDGGHAPPTSDPVQVHHQQQSDSDEATGTGGLLEQIFQLQLQLQQQQQQPGRDTFDRTGGGDGQGTRDGGECGEAKHIGVVVGVAAAAFALGMLVLVLGLRLCPCCKRRLRRSVSVGSDRLPAYGDVAALPVGAMKQQPGTPFGDEDKGRVAAFDGDGRPNERRPASGRGAGRMQDTAVVEGFEEVPVHVPFEHVPPPSGSRPSSGASGRSAPPAYDHGGWVKSDDSAA